jgi:ribosomal protein L12E/L44/L45/RPP1/RPP2
VITLNNNVIKYTIAPAAEAEKEKKDEKKEKKEKAEKKEKKAKEEKGIGLTTTGEKKKK